MRLKDFNQTFIRLFIKFSECYLKDTNLWLIRYLKPPEIIMVFISSCDSHQCSERLLTIRAILIPVSRADSSAMIIAILRTFKTMKIDNYLQFIFLRHIHSPIKFLARSTKGSFAFKHPISDRYTYCIHAMIS